MKSNQDTIEYLQKRVAYLEDSNDQMQRSLESLRSLADFQRRISNNRDLAFIFAESTQQILQLVPFKVVGFYGCGRDLAEFVPEFVHPEFMRSDLEVEVNQQIETGMFAWALYQARPVYSKPLHLQKERDIILHTLSTERQVLGMFIGQLAVAREALFAEALDFLNVALMTSALAIENAKLYEEVEQQNQSLERRVRERTAEVTRVNRKLQREIKIRQEGEEGLRKSEQRFRALFENSPDAILVQDEQGRLLDANPAACALFRMSRRELLRKRLVELFVQRDQERIAAHLKSGSSDAAIFEGRCRTGRGGSVPVEARSRRIEYADRRAWLVHVHDISVRKRTEQMLRKAKEAAEAANQAKSEFLANMSHEIRTPLNAVIGMTELALDTPLSAEQKNYLKTVHAASQTLLQLVNDILDFSKIEAGRLKLQTTSVDLLAVVEQVLEIAAGAAGHLEIEMFVDPALPTKVLGDGVRLKQILLNLVSNAVKFTREGRVAIIVEPDRDAGGSTGERRLRYHIQVRDTGIGIPPQELERIFSKFAQVDASSTRQYGGTGLGLSIVHALVEQMGGKIWVESQVEVGSTFHVVLPLQRDESASPVPPVKDQALLSGYSVLVVKPGPTLLPRLLSEWGFLVTACEDARAALTALEERTAVFDLVLLDQKIAGLEKLDEWLRTSRYQSTKCITLRSLYEPPVKLEHAPALALLKPVRQSELLRAVLQVLEVVPSPDRTNGQSAPERGRNSESRILLVEDNVDNQKLAVTILRKAGYQVDVANHGEEAVAAFSPGTHCLVLMDIQMPVMDGFQATKKIRDREKRAGIPRVPIVALTAHALQGYEEKCRRKGMDDILTKPFTKAALLQKVEYWLPAQCVPVSAPSSPRPAA